MIDLRSIKWTPVIIGIIIAFILSWFLSVIGYFIATVYVGYSVDGEYINGAIHGALVGVITAIIGGILGLIIYS